MKHARWIIVVFAATGCAFAAACSGDNNDTDGGSDASNDTTQQPDTNKPDTGGNDAANDAKSDATADAACPASWLDLPDATMLEPDSGLPGLLIHALGAGTQDYSCEAQTVASDAGDAGDATTTTYAWVLTGPEATLDDCNATLIGHHFASEAGASAPEWQTLDNSFVIGKKLVAYTPDGGQGSVPWLLLQETSNGGTGTISKTLYIQRLHTDGGLATGTCDSNNVDASTKASYSADYYFYGN